MTARTPETAGWRRKVSTEWRSTARPPSGRYCFGTSPPRRVPAPAATIRAMELVICSLELGGEAKPKGSACQGDCRQTGTTGARARTAAYIGRHVWKPAPEPFGPVLFAARFARLAAAAGRAGRSVLDVAGCCRRRPGGRRHRPDGARLAGRHVGRALAEHRRQ